MDIELQNFETEDVRYYVFCEATHEHTGDKIIVYLKNVYFDQPYIQWGHARVNVNDNIPLGYAFITEEEARYQADCAEKAYELRYFKIDGEVKIIAIKTKTVTEMSIVQEI